MKKYDSVKPTKTSQSESKLIANDAIPFDAVQVIDNTGKNLGLMVTHQAVQLALSSGYDLVVVSVAGSGKSCIARFMNMSKELYDRKKKEKIMKKKQHEVHIKELRFSPRIGDHDLQNKANQAASFLLDGNKVKFMLVFKGREKMLKDTAAPSILFNNLIQRLSLLVEGSGKQLALEQESEAAMGFYRLYFLKKQQ